MTEVFGPWWGGVGEGKHNSNTPDPKGSVDDGKRALAQLEVDLSPLRATKGGVWGGKTRNAPGGRQGSVDFAFILGAFFALVAHFFDFFTHLKLSCIFVRFFEVSGVIFRGFGRVWGVILGGFFDDFW